MIDTRGASGTAADQSQSAPAPDYGSDRGAEVEVCSCDEALALRAELERLQAETWSLGTRGNETAARLADAKGELEALEKHHELERQARKRAEAEAELLRSQFLGVAGKLDSARERIERARKILSEARPVDSPESRLASDLREVLGE